MPLKTIVQRLGSPSRDQVRACWVKGSTYLGIYLVNIWGVTSMIWGNLSVYTSSYFYLRVEDPGEVQTPWPVSFFFIFWALGMLIAKSLYDRLGKRVACFLGILLVDGGFLLSYVTVQHSVVALAMTLGVSIGLGCGIISSITLVCAAEWADRYVGLATGGVPASAGLGAAVSNQVITFYANPDNLAPDGYNGQARYFSQPEVLDRVPSLFLLLGGISLVLNLVGVAFLRDRHETEKPAATECATLLDGGPKGSNGSLGDVARSGGEQKSTRNRLERSVQDDNELTPSNLEKLKRHQKKEGNGLQQTTTENQCFRQGRLSSRDFTPKEILRTFTFYALALSIMAADLTFLTITTYYKTFGLLYITDDHFMTNIGTFLVVSIAFFSCLSGFVTDNVSLKTTLVASISSLTVISSFYFFMPMLNKWVFGVTTIVYAGTMYFNYSAFMVATLKFFGPTFYSTNYGLATVAGITMNFVAPPLIEHLVKVFGWFYLFFAISLVNFISLILVIWGFPAKTWLSR